MKLVSKAAALVFAVMTLAACGMQSTPTIEELNKANPTGSPFTKSLTAEYRTFANTAQKDDMDYADALHFARKGLASASAVVVMPETLADWDLSEGNLAEMTPLRDRLVDALERGGRDLAADKAAVAQVRFDCWAEQQEENWTANVPCRNQFLAALKALEDAIPAAAPPAPKAEELPPPVTEAPAGEKAAVEQAMFIVFFDWDKYNLSSGANDVLDAVAREIKSRTDMKGIVIHGHTDTSGGKEYNQKLSVRRAQAARDGLVARGVPAATVRIEAHGETDLLVQTPDNVREPANRRAQITLE